jgi:hypothetical protein
MVHFLMKRKLADLAVIKAGHPLRGKIEEIKDGTARVLQIRDLDEFGRVKNWNSVVRTELAGRKRPEWLERGDILFAARGLRNFAGCINDIPESTVCGPHFFQIHVRNRHQVLPEYLAWALNQQPIQKYFKQSAEGTLQLSIRRAVLEDTEIAIPTLAKQELIVDLYKAAINEQSILKALLVTREQEMNFIAQDILG